MSHTDVAMRSTTTAEAIALRQFEMMRRGSFEDFEALVHADCINREASDEPPAARQAYGPAAVYATAIWLRDAFADLRWEVHDVVADGELVVIHCTMKGTHMGPYAVYDEQGQVKQVFPPTGKPFAATQTHWFRVAEGKLIEHWANRDDLGMAEQAGWVPPSPIYLARMAIAKGRARRSA